MKQMDSFQEYVYFNRPKSYSAIQIIAKLNIENTEKLIGATGFEPAT